jgi:hypothetical protein
MKVIFFCSYYDAYLSAFYKKNNGLEKHSYQQQMTELKNDYFGHWASYTDYFVKLGADAELIIPNCKPLQIAWAKENNSAYNERDWNFSIPLAQVKKAKPDIFYISSMFEYYNGFLEEVKKYVRHIFGWINCAIPRGLKLNNIELLLTAVPHFVENFRNNGIKSEMLKSAFDPAILGALGPCPRQDIDFSFIGSLTTAHSNRVKMIKKLMDQTGLQFFGTGIHLIPDERNFLQRLFSKNTYEQREMGEVWGLDMYRTLQRSKITFNAHIDISREFIGNMRMYEATGAGTLLLTDGKNAPLKNFSEDEVVYYNTIDDAIEKANYYLHHEEERLAIAKRGQQRTLNDYNYEISSRQLLRYFKQYLN